MTSWDIVISTEDVSQRYDEIGRISARSWGDPLDMARAMDNVDVRLRERAAKMRANAVVRVTYAWKWQALLGPDLLVAEGTAVVLPCACDTSPGLIRDGRCLECGGLALAPPK
jgi:uncharacterized protein YbjQ (UPF0145 family)